MLRRGARRCAPGTLRIDIGAPADQNVIIYTRDSSYRIRGGKLIHSEADANPFMPFVATMYHVPVRETLGELARWKFDLSRIRADTLDGRLTWVAGARDAADLTSPQFWVDAERLVTNASADPPLSEAGTRRANVLADSLVPAVIRALAAP